MSNSLVHEFRKKGSVWDRKLAQIRRRGSHLPNIDIIFGQLGKDHPKMLLSLL